MKQFCGLLRGNLVLLAPIAAGAYVIMDWNYIALSTILAARQPAVDQTRALEARRYLALAQFPVSHKATRQNSSHPSRFTIPKESQHTVTAFHFAAH
jgi:hypothetical protein